MDEKELYNPSVDNNDDMIASEDQLDKSVSFAASEPSMPERGWTKEQKRQVWITAVIVTVIVAVGVFLLKSLGILM